MRHETMTGNPTGDTPEKKPKKMGRIEMSQEELLANASPEERRAFKERSKELAGQAAERRAQSQDRTVRKDMAEVQRIQKEINEPRKQDPQRHARAFPAVTPEMKERMIREEKEKKEGGFWGKIKSLFQ